MSRHAIISALGVTQILAWGSSYYLPAVLAAPIARDTGWPLTWIVGGLSFGLLVAALVSPHVGRAAAAPPYLWPNLSPETQTQIARILAELLRRMLPTDVAPAREMVGADRRARR
jgi:hypothetical protein